MESLQIRERAQGLVEYGLIIALVAVLAIAGLIIFGPAVSALLSKLGGSVSKKSPGGDPFGKMSDGLISSEVGPFIRCSPQMGV